MNDDLARIRAWRDEYGRRNSYHSQSWRDIVLLLAEIDRRDAILRPIALADPTIPHHDGDRCFYCGWKLPDEPPAEHPEDCLWRQVHELDLQFGDLTPDEVALLRSFGIEPGVTCPWRQTRELLGDDHGEHAS